MCKFVKHSTFLRLKQEEIEIMNNSNTSTKLDAIVKNFPQNKAQDQMASQKSSTKHLDKS